MGIWRVTRGKGSASPEEAKEIIELLTIDMSVGESKGYQKGIFFMQISKGVMGINQWIQEDGTIDFHGTLFERNYEVDDICKEVDLLSQMFPSLELTMYVESPWKEWESEEDDEAIITLKRGSLLLEQFD